MIKVYRPVKTDRLTQGFGENNACAKVDAQGNAIKPYVLMNAVAGKCVQGFRSLYHLLGVAGHAGYDFAGYRGEPIHFDIDTGEENVEWEAINLSSAEGGLGVLLHSLKPVKLDRVPLMKGAQFKMVETEYNRYGGAVYLLRYYGHLQATAITKERQIIKTGGLIGYMGDSGAATGVHTHRYLAVGGHPQEGPFFIKDGDSEYKGRFSEDEYMVNTFVLDAIKKTADDTEKIAELIAKRNNLLEIVVDLLGRLAAALTIRKV